MYPNLSKLKNTKGADNLDIDVLRAPPVQPLTPGRLWPAPRPPMPGDVYWNYGQFSDPRNVPTQILDDLNLSAILQGMMNTTGIYLMDGSNIFFEGNRADTADQCARVAKTLNITGRARRPVVVVLKRQTNIGQPRFQEYLSHLVSDTNPNPNVFIVQIDMRPCDGNVGDTNCVEKQGRMCTYRHDKQLLNVPAPYNTRFVYEEVTEPLSGHLFCEYDDIILSSLFWRIDHPGVEVISRDRAVLKSPNLINMTFNEMKEMHTNYGNKTFAPVNLITNCYNMYVNPSTQQEQDFFINACFRGGVNTPVKRSVTPEGVRDSSNKSSRSTPSTIPTTNTPRSST
jgi:hypothetical protein